MFLFEYNRKYFMYILLKWNNNYENSRNLIYQLYISINQF